MTLLLRPFEPARDYPAIIAVANTSRPYRLLAEHSLRYADEHHDQRYLSERWVAEQDAQVVGWGEYLQLPWRYTPGSVELEVFAALTARRQGIGAALYERLLEGLRSHQVGTTVAIVRQDEPDALRFLAARGFTEQWRAWESRLDLTHFDPNCFPTPELGAIAIKTLAELDRDPPPDFERRLHVLTMALDRDIPSPEPFEPVSLEYFVAMAVRGPQVIPEAYYVAFDGDLMVAHSALHRSQGLTDVVQTGLTGVVRTHRRRGIARALKLRGIQYAIEHGCREVRTWNDAVNRPMLSINEALGFAKQPAWIHYVRALDRA